MRIQVLGPGCKNCRRLEQNTVTALDQLGLDAQIENVTDYAEIAAYGVMKTPALVINDHVVLSGKSPPPQRSPTSYRPPHPELDALQEQRHPAGCRAHHFAGGRAAFRASGPPHH